MNALRRWLECRAASGVIEAYLDGDRPRLAPRVERHVRDCARCRAWAEALSAQVRLLEQLGGEEDPPAGFVDRVMQRVEEAEAPMMRRQAWRPAVAVGAAAVVALALAAWLIIRSGGPTVIPPTEAPAPPQVVQAPAPPPAIAPAPPAAGEAPAVAPAPAPRRRIEPPRPAKAPAPLAEAPPTEAVEVAAATPSAEEYRAAGRSYEEEGRLEEALAAYAAAREVGGSQMARIDAARAYEKWGYTAQAVDELMVLAFADPDEDHWETLAVH